MKLSRKIKFGLVFILSNIALLAVFQNFTSKEQAELSKLKDNLEKIRIPNIFANCEDAGTFKDKRPASVQYKCNEFPFGDTSLGISPKTYDDFLIKHPIKPTQAQLLGMSITKVSCHDIDSRSERAICNTLNQNKELAKKILSNPTQKPVLEICNDDNRNENNARKARNESAMLAYNILSVYPKVPTQKDCSDIDSRNAQRSCNSDNTAISSIYSAAKTLLADQLAAWNAETNTQKELLNLWKNNKLLVDQKIPFTDKAGKSRSIKFYMTMNRDLIESNVNVSVGNKEIGVKDYGSQKISKPSGHHFYNLNKDNQTISACTYFPGMRITGHKFGSDYTIFEKWWGSYSISFSLNPGSFKFDRFETCNLLKINPLEVGNKKISLIGLKSPKFVGMQLSGLAFDLDIGVFGWFVVALLAALASLIPFIGPAIATAIVTSVFLVCETNIPSKLAEKYINKEANSYDTSEAWDKLLNNINTSEANVKTGGYIQDIATIGLLRTTVIPSLKEQMNIHAQVEALRVIDPKAVADYEKTIKDALTQKATNIVAPPQAGPTAGNK